MLRTRRAVGSAAALAVASLVITACGGSSSSTGTTGGNKAATGSGTGFSKISQNGSLAGAVKGGVLSVVGASDVDYLDPNISYYSVGYQASRLYSRQLYSYPGVQGQTTNIEPDLATGPPVISNGGKTYTITIKQGAKWDTSPARQVTEADFQRGVDITCNPGPDAFGGQGDYNALLVGYTAFCGHPAVAAAPASGGNPAVKAEPATGFASAPATPQGISNYLKTHSISGITQGSTPETIVINLTQPATYFENELGLTAFSPRPVEMLKYLPGSSGEAQHTVSDGPYKVASYQPTKSIDFVRNPDWDPTTDTLRHAFVNEIKITELGGDPSNDQKIVEQEVVAGRADLMWDIGLSPQDANSLLKENSPLENVQSEIASNPYLVFNTQSPNNSGALKNAAVRQAISYAIDRANLLQDLGGPKLAPALTHVLPAQIGGGSKTENDAFPYNPTKAKSLLASSNASKMTLTFLYRATTASTAIFQDVQNQLGKVGIKVKGLVATPADFYVKYLEKPTSATSGAWDIALAGWGPDWYGNAALSFFEPLFDGRVLPPASSNFGLFKDATVDTLLDTASKATSVSEANADWAKADNQVIQDAAIYPITDPNEALVHAANVHNDVYVPVLQAFDLTNVWLSGS